VHLEANSVPYEIVRLSLQALIIVVITALIGWATFEWQQVRLERSKKQAEERDKEVDARRRLDDRVVVFFNETVKAYNDVKQVRRLLGAETGPEKEAAISLDAYSRLISVLSDHQLVFESLMRRAPLLQPLITGAYDISYQERTDSEARTHDSLKDIYDCVQGHLNKLVKDHNDVRGKL
jgi:hypothetical protein